MRKKCINLETLLKNANSLRNMQAKLSSKYLQDECFSPSELNILILLSNNPNIDTAKELVVFLGVSKGLVCRSLDSLLDKCYIHVEEDEKDHRIQRITLDSSAKRVIKQMEKVRFQMEQHLLEGISVNDIHIFETVLKKMSENVKELEENIR